MRKKETMSFEPTFEQKKIFDFFKKGRGNGMIDAVAGSGKTSTIIEGIKYINKRERILFCAFNKKIQEEINKKTSTNSNVIVKTTYALGLTILKKHFDAINNTSKPDTSKYYNILNDKLLKDNETKKYLYPSKFTRCFERIKTDYDAKNRENENANFYKTFFSNYYRLIDLLRFTLSYGKGDSVFKKLVEKYAIDIDSEDFQLLKLYRDLVEEAIEEGNKRARTLGVIDFADMIFLPCEFKLRSPVQFDIVFVDECQDLSNAQLKTITKYLKNGGRFFAVGDPYQSIYGFAGASPESFNNIKKIFKPKMFKLTNCFRCSKEIVDLAKEVREDITTNNAFKSEIKSIKFHEIVKYVKQEDFVLARHNCDLFELVFEFLKVNIKCKILGKKEILKSLKDIIPNSKFDNELYYENLPIHLDKIYKDSERGLGNNPANYEKLENLGDSINILESCFFNNETANNLNDLFEYIENLMDGEDKDSVLLSSIHKSKGLEGETVFVIGYDKLPYKKENMLDWQIYQEECLKYVAITRAKINLYQTESPPDNDSVNVKFFGVEEHCDLGNEIDNLPF
ncbi:UvrD-helicase domain-containing protein [Tenacibaculum maritimum]|uniref:UvrD-helicase domain-containing protein n=3 Tax=Tenacibaculum maritimum TaxID=107401 RepID=UPI001A96638A|nr:ATP-dependent helicase [Tenacibaculum maritimum]